VLRATGAILAILITSSVVGCGSAETESAWASAQGGVVRGDPRVQAACSLLGTSLKSAVHVHVLDSAIVCAYGWPDGNLFVTRGLVELLNDQELAAAIAHEMGHLLNDGHLHTVVNLRGCCVSPDVEARADAIGVRLLNQRGIDCKAMISMLEKVKSSPGVPPSCQTAISHRIELLNEVPRPN